ncbi:MAG: ACP S-malonyltransferase [Chitinophagaceae bacterium]
MKRAVIFPGQGSQFPGMGKSLFDTHELAMKLFKKADDLLGFCISDIMFFGSEEDLRQTKVTQPAVFLHAVIGYYCLEDLHPAMVAGHSLGEFSALVANQVLDFEDALRLVAIRANAMQKACQDTPSAMAAVLGLADDLVEEICLAVQQQTGEVVVPANYNCPGQLVISGSVAGISVACDRLKAAGAKRALLLPVGGAFHSPLMAPAKEELKQAILTTSFHDPICPVYQNVVAKGIFSPQEIQQNLINQLTGPVRWTQLIEAMVSDGAEHFTEVGPGKVLQGLVQKIARGVKVDGFFNG